MKNSLRHNELLLRKKLARQWQLYLSNATRKRYDEWSSTSSCLFVKISTIYVESMVRLISRNSSFVLRAYLSSYGSTSRPVVSLRSASEIHEETKVELILNERKWMFKFYILVLYLSLRHRRRWWPSSFRPSQPWTSFPKSLPLFLMRKNVIRKTYKTRTFSKHHRNNFQHKTHHLGCEIATLNI